MKNFVLPDWFYLPQETATKALTTDDGSFDASKALAANDAWVSTIEQSSPLQEKKILIADYTIKQEKNRYINVAAICYRVATR